MADTENIFERNLAPRQANFRPLSPISFLQWSAHVYPDKTAVIHGRQRYTWRQFDERCRRLASALNKRGVGLGDGIAVVVDNHGLAEVIMVGVTTAPVNRYDISLVFNGAGFE